MSTTITFTPIYGSHMEGATCSLLQIDEVSILLDCGWDERLDLNYIEPLRKICPDITVILISNPDFEHIGALPYARKEFGLTAPVYITQSTKTFGNLQFKDFLKMRNIYENFTVFTMKDVDEAFSAMKSASYGQTNYIRGRSTTTIISHPAGRLLGSAIWEINYELEKIIYAVNFELERSVLSANVSGETFKDATLVITDAKWDPESTKTSKSSQENNFLDYIENALRSTTRGTPKIIIPQNSCGRALPILFNLKRLWDEKNLWINFGLVFFSPHSQIIYDTAKNAIASSEDREIPREKDGEVQCFEAMDRLLNFIYGDEKVQSRGNVKPIVVVCSSMGLETGFSQKLIIYCGGKPSPDVTSEASIEKIGNHYNYLLFTELPPPGTLAAEIFLAHRMNPMNLSEQQFTFVNRNREFLSGSELKQYYKKKDKERVEAVRNEVVVGDLLDLDVFDDAIDELKFGKYTTPQHEMFEYEDDAIEFDDYGQQIDPKEYTKNVTTYREQEKMVSVSNEERPSKTQEKSDTIRLMCKIEETFLDGRCPGDTVRETFTTYPPNSVILINGNHDNTMRCLGFLQSTFQNRHPINFFAPGNYEPVTIRPPVVTCATLKVDLQKYIPTRLEGFYFYKLCGYLEEEENEDQIQELRLKDGMEPLDDTLSLYIRNRDITTREIKKRLIESFIKVEIDPANRSVLKCTRGDDVVSLTIRSKDISIDGSISLLYDDVKMIVQKQFESL